jgi:hypothetical protein
VKLRFALLASLRSAIFSENKVDKKLITLPEGVKKFLRWNAGLHFERHAARMSQKRSLTRLFRSLSIS